MPYAMSTRWIPIHKFEGEDNIAKVRIPASAFQFDVSRHPGGNFVVVSFAHELDGPWYAEEMSICAVKLLDGDRPTVLPCGERFPVELGCIDVGPSRFRLFEIDRRRVPPAATYPCIDADCEAVVDALKRSISDVRAVKISPETILVALIDERFNEHELSGREQAAIAEFLADAVEQPLRRVLRVTPVHPADWEATPPNDGSDVSFLIRKLSEATEVKR